MDGEKRINKKISLDRFTNNAISHPTTLILYISDTAFVVKISKN